MKNKGFTLIELLVVIAIIAILASILFPVFSRVREKARQASCMSNLKNLGLALRMYSQDYDERLPAAADRFGRGGPWPNPAGDCILVSFCGWTYQTAAYIKSEQVLLCPNWQKFKFVHVPAPDGNPQTWPTTYWISQPLVSASESEIQRPANKVMLYDCLAYHYDGQGANVGMNNNSPRPGVTEMVAFADGHVKFIGLDRAWGPTSFMCGQLDTPPNLVNKWNINSGWSDGWGSSPPPGNCANDPTPATISGRSGSNF